MGVKYIKGNVDIISMVVAQWELTGRLNEIEYRFLLEKVEELHGSLKLVRPNTKFIMAEEVAAEGLREFSIDMGTGEQSDTPAEQPDTETEPEPDTEKSVQVEVEAEAETEVEIEVEVEPAVHEDAEEKQPEDHSETLRRGKLRKNAVRALYDTGDDKPEVETVKDTVEENEALAAEDAAADAVTTDTPIAEVEVDAEADEDLEVHEEVSETTDVKEVVETAETTGESTTVEEEKQVSPASPEDATGGESDKSDKPVATETKAAVLGEIINSGGHVLGETLQALSSRSVASAVTGKISSLRKSVGINDKYIMINDLFDGDAEAYENAIGTLDSFTTLDDAMLWIYDNYEWSPEDGGTKTLMDLLVRKLS